MMNSSMDINYARTFVVQNNWQMLINVLGTGDPAQDAGLLKLLQDDPEERDGFLLRPQIREWLTEVDCYDIGLMMLSIYARVSDRLPKDVYDARICDFIAATMAHMVFDRRWKDLQSAMVVLPPGEYVDMLAKAIQESTKEQARCSMAMQLSAYCLYHLLFVPMPEEPPPNVPTTSVMLGVIFGMTLPHTLVAHASAGFAVLAGCAKEGTDQSEVFGTLSKNLPYIVNSIGHLRNAFEDPAPHTMATALGPEE